MSNPYAKFMHLLPKDRVWIGKVTAINSDGTVLVLEAGSNNPIKVKGIVSSGTSDTYQVNDYVEVVNYVIQSKIAALQSLVNGMVI